MAGIDVVFHVVSLFVFTGLTYLYLREMRLRDFMNRCVKGYLIAALPVDFVRRFCQAYQIPLQVHDLVESGTLTKIYATMWVKAVLDLRITRMELRSLEKAASSFGLTVVCKSVPADSTQLAESLRASLGNAFQIYIVAE